MLELIDDALVFSFPEIHPDARLTIDFQRTLRIPDDGRDYPLPPGLGRFPVRHLDAHADRVPESWLRRGGVLLPMYQSEALWLNFEPYRPRGRQSAYPFAVKVGAGKINAVSGSTWSNALHQKRDFDAPSDYVVIPAQPWLDGYAIERGRIRQFVAMPLGAGYSAEEQLTGSAEFGGMQLIVYPMRGDVYDRLFPYDPRHDVYDAWDEPTGSLRLAEADDEGGMGLGAGGSMRQEIYDDAFEFTDWAHDTSSRCFVHLTNSMLWRAFTGAEPPHPPPTSGEYTSAGLPWFDYYDDRQAVGPGSKVLDSLKTVAQLGNEKGEKPLPENASVEPEHVVDMGKRNPQVIRDGDF